MNYLITAAGKGSRFINEGIKPPKPLIKVFGNELLIWSLNSFRFKSQDNLFIVTLQTDKVKERLEQKVKNLYPDLNVYWLELNEMLQGQLLTAIKAIEFFCIKGKLVIHNCDTSFKFNTEEINNLLEKNKIFGIIPCFKEKGNHWSFAKSLDEDPSNAIEVREKKRISDNCSVGTYIFSSTNLLIKLSNEYINKNKNKDIEFYIAPIFQYALEKHFKVKITKANDVRAFGTPLEILQNFGISFDELLGENSWNAHQRKTLVIDIDKTICLKKDHESYADAKPIKKVCEIVKREHYKGTYIILFTSRNMRTFKGSLGLINKITAPTLTKWLSNNNIPYDEIYYGKPWGMGVSYIDDKNISIENFITN